MNFFLPMLPPTATHQEKKWRVVNGKPVPYEPENVQTARAKLSAHLASRKPDQPMRGPLRLVVKWCFPMPSNHTNGEYKTSKPDTDNLNKLLKDVMTSLGFWKDDAQVASEIIEKFWSDTPGIFISLEQIGG